VSIFARPKTQTQSQEQYVRYNAEARLYEYEGNFFVCTVHGIAETDSLTMLNADADDADDAALGEAVLRHLAEYSASDGRNHRDAKVSDWMAFKASGSKSIKSFERVLWHVDLAIMNSALMVWARPRLSLKGEIAAYASGSHNLAERAGETVRKALAAAKVLREQGVV
jgi:hypothetical protein